MYTINSKTRVIKKYVFLKKKHQNFFLCFKHVLVNSYYSKVFFYMKRNENVRNWHFKFAKVQCYQYCKKIT